MSKKKHKRKYESFLNFLPEPVATFGTVENPEPDGDTLLFDPPERFEDLLEQIESEGRADRDFPLLSLTPTLVAENGTPQTVQKATSKESRKKNRSTSEYEIAKFIVDNYPAGLFQDVPYVRLDGIHVPLTDRLVGKLIDKSFEAYIKKGISSNAWKSIYEWVHVLLDNADHILHLPERKILFENGAFDFVTRKKVSLLDSEFIPVKINARYEPKELPETSVFDRFLEDCSNGDSEVKSLILAFLGYMISPGSGKHLIAMGEAPDSGKSLLANLTRDLLGRKNTCAISLHRFTNAFEMAQLLGKSANFCMDISGAVLNENTVAILKRLTGSDPETLNPKYKAPIQYENFAKMVFACNEGGLRLKTPDKGFENRLTVIPFLKSVAPEDIDPDLPGKLWEERDGIVYHAVEALRTLYLNKYRFPYCRAGETLKAKWMQCSNRNLQQFVEDECTLSTDARIWTSDLYNQYIDYCYENSIEPMSKQAFTRSMYSVPGTSPEKWQENGTQLRGIRGVGLKSSSQLYPKNN